MKKRCLYVLMVVCMIITLIPLGGVDGFAETNITRAEWIAKLVTVFNMSVEDESTMPDNYFSDITSDMDCYENILLATEFGVIDLEAGEAFEPNKAATREFAAQTLNYCLHFQVDENTEYTYSEAAEENYPDDLQVAVNRGWFKLSSNKVLPKQAVNMTEAENMLNDAKKILADEYIDEAYESKYNFGDNVKVIPETENVKISLDFTVTITDYDCNIAKDDIFVAYSAGIPVALKAVKTEKQENVTIITAEQYEKEGIIKSVDSEGVAEFDLENFETNEVETYSVTDVESNNTEEMNIKLRSISYDKKSKKLTATKDIKIDGSTGGSITVEVSDLKLYHKENTSTGEYMAYVEGNTSVTKSISFDLGNYVGIPSSITLGYINIGGVGSVSLDVSISIKGGMSSNETGVITAGWSHTRNDGFRIIKGYKKTAYSFTAEAEVKVGLTLSAQIDLVVVNGSIWATVGVKGYYKFKDYTYVDGERPLQCKTIGGYLYANVGARVSINYFVDKKSWSKTVDIYTESNSPIRVCYHYEDNQLVDSCTRGKTNNEAYVKYTTHTNSIHFNPSPSYGQSSYTGSNGTTTTLWTYTTDNDGNATITGYKGSATSIAIPSKVDGYVVNKIGNSAFKYNAKLRSVTIPDSVTKIGYYAFENCTLLSNVKLSENIESIDDYAFRNCTALKHIKIPKTLTMMDSYGIFNNSGLESVEFEDGMTKLPSYIFKGAYNLKTVPLLDTITEIGDSAFAYCTSLESITIPDSVTKIGNYAFAYCTSLANITIPDSVTKIGYYAFENCTLLKEINLPDSITSMGDSTFSGCTSLEKVKLPNTRQNIMASMFYNCKNLKEIVLPETVTTIRNSAFYVCTSLSSISLPVGLQTIENSSFYKCEALEKIIIPQNVTSVGTSAFYNCDTLTSAVINGSGSIGSSAFYDCDALTSITIGDGVTEIGSQMCYGCDKLTDVKLGKYITKIPDSAFRLCSKLQTVTLPRFCKTVAANAFAEDTKLTSVYVPETVSSIQNNSFSYPKKTVMYGKAGSYAEEYATGRGMTFNGVNAPITSISYLEDNIKIARYKTVKPNVRIMPDFDTDTITFVSADPKIVTVEADGAVYGKAYGNTKITATTSSGVSAVLNVSVVIPATSVELSDENVTLVVGGSKQISANIYPNNSTDEIKWSSDNTSVAIVNNKGKITAVGKGTANITATAVYGNRTAKCSVKVENPNGPVVNVTGIKLNPDEQEITIGKTYTLKPEIIPLNATLKLVEWSTSNSSVADVEDGEVTAKSLGTATITAKTLNGGYVASCVVTVIPKIEITQFSAENNGTTALVKLSVVNSPEDAFAYIAAYDRIGRLLEIQKMRLNNGSTSANFSKSNVAKYKAFIWKDNYKPLSDTKECVLK